MKPVFFSRWAAILAGVLMPFMHASLAGEAGGQERIITADMNEVAGPLDTSFKECVGAGRANEGLRADWQDQLREARRECGFKYIRMHGLLTDDMGDSGAGWHFARAKQRRSRIRGDDPG